MRTWFWPMLLPALCVCASEEWPQFRGPTGQGWSGADRVPLSWSETRNVRWKAAVPGSGYSSPIVSSNQVWLTTASDDGKSLRAVCVDRASGKMLHNVEVFRRAAAERITDAVNGYASPTPVIESGRVYVSFGPNGVACLAAETGRVLWRNSDLVYHHDSNGAGSSPVLCGTLLVLNCDGIDQRYVAALDKHAGKLVWKTPRSSPITGGGAARKSFSTPLVVTLDGETQVLSAGALRVSAYQPVTGRELWFCDLVGNTIVPRPVCQEGVLYVCTGLPRRELWAIRAPRHTAGTNAAVLWKSIRQVPTVASPVLAGEQLFWVSDDGIVCCSDVRTGREIWSERIGGKHFASPVLAAGRLYFCDDAGATVVVKPGLPPMVLTTNRLDAGFMASPAVAGRALYLRTKTHVYRIQE